MPLDLQTLPSLAGAPATLVGANQQVLKVPCPYCPLGFAEVVMTNRGDRAEVEGIKDPRRCLTCKRYFALRPRVVLEGVRLEDMR